MHKSVYAIWFLVIALVLGAWTIPPRAQATSAQLLQDETLDCHQAATMLAPSLAENPDVSNRIEEICSFRVRSNQVNRNASALDRQFIENAIGANMLEIQTLQYARDRVMNEEWRGMIDAMLAMHTADLQMAVALAERIGANTEPDLTNAAVFPGTAAYDLGERRVNLVSEFLEPLTMSGGGMPGTPTAIPTLDFTATATPASVETATPTVDSTATPEEITATPTEDVTPTPADVTATSTGIITETPTEVTETPATEVTATPAEITAIPTLDLTATPTLVPTSTPAGPVQSINFDLLSFDILEDEHVMSLETALAAERLVRNDEIRAFAKHTADIARLHLMLMRDLKLRLAYSFTPPPPDFEAEYQSPRRFGPR